MRNNAKKPLERYPPRSPCPQSDLVHDAAAGSEYLEALVRLSLLQRGRDLDAVRQAHETAGEDAGFRSTGGEIATARCDPETIHAKGYSVKMRVS